MYAVFASARITASKVNNEPQYTVEKVNNNIVNNKKNKKALKILLMQIRQHQQVAQEEHMSFATYAELEKSQIDILNVFDTPDFDETILQGYDALWVGGASEANVLQPELYPFINSAQNLLAYCCQQSIPVFASCFGFQLAVLALGGEIVDSEADFELGTIPISLTEFARNDILLKDTPNDFLAVSVHRQKALKTPKGCQLLAQTKTCLHIIKVRDKPFWAFQFHPEVNKSTLIERLTIYQNGYTKGKEHLAQVLSNAEETPESNILMKKFVDRVLLA